MYFQVNTEGVVVDLTLTPMYVTKNKESKILVLTSDESKAIGCVSSDGAIIRYFEEPGENNTWNTLSAVVFVNDEDVPEDYENNKYTYSPEEGLQLYDGIVPETNMVLTEESIINSDGLLDIADMTDANSSAIDTLISNYDLLDARVTALEEKINSL